LEVRRFQRNRRQAAVRETPQEHRFDSGTEPRFADHVTDLGDNRLWDQQLITRILQQLRALAVVIVRAVEGRDQRPGIN